MPHSRNAPSPVPDRDPDRSSAPLNRRSRDNSHRSFPENSEADRVTPWGALILLYEMPARWVRAYLSTANGEGPWDGSDREFLCGPFSTDLHPPDT